MMESTPAEYVFRPPTQYDDPDQYLIKPIDWTENNRAFIRDSDDHMWNGILSNSEQAPCAAENLKEQTASQIASPNTQIMSAPSSRSILKTQTILNQNENAPSQQQGEVNSVLSTANLLLSNQQYSSNSSTNNAGQQIKKERLESDGDSNRSSSPQSSTPSDSDPENEPIFRHQINLHEYISDGVMKNRSEPVAEPINNGQQWARRRSYSRIRKEEEDKRKVALDNNTLRNTLSDHCYHLNQARNLQRLGIEPYSESGEYNIHYLFEIS